VDPRTGLDVVAKRKLCTFTVYGTPVVKPVARHTGLAIPAHTPRLCNNVLQVLSEILFVPKRLFNDALEHVPVTRQAH
jgi:hypothetical protein